MNIAQHILIFTVRLYRVVSPAKAMFFGPLAHCRFEPSCSSYALQAIQRHGAIAGTILTLGRLCRCHPWGGCGPDPVPDQFNFSSFNRFFSRLTHRKALNHGS